MPPHLQNARLAYVDPSKVRDYLLVPKQRGDKSAFFARFGFRRERWEDLRDALLLHVQRCPVTSLRHHEYGVNCVVEGPLQTPGGREPIVETVWLVTSADAAPWFVTARPVRRTAR